jgi:hypothetical protein
MTIDPEFERLAVQLREVESLIDAGEEKLGRRAPRGSDWSVGEQIDHLTKVLERALALLLTSTTALPKGINLTGRIFLVWGRIPRGVGKSPQTVRGAERPGAELRLALTRIRPLADRLRETPAPRPLECAPCPTHAATSA